MVCWVDTYLHFIPFFILKLKCTHQSLISHYNALYMFGLCVFHPSFLCEDALFTYQYSLAPSHHSTDTVWWNASLLLDCTKGIPPRLVSHWLWPLSGLLFATPCFDYFVIVVFIVVGHERFQVATWTQCKHIINCARGGSRCAVSRRKRA